MPISSVSNKTRNTTWYLLFILLISILGPLQFGFHLVGLNAPQKAITCETEASVTRKLDRRGGDGRAGRGNGNSGIASASPSASASGTTVSPAGISLPHCIPMNAGQFGFVTSIYTLGGLVGALSGGMCSTRYGRLQTMRGTTLLFIAGSVLQTLAPNMALFAVGRTIAGLGAGAAIVVVPVYISEVAPPAEKGLFGALTQVAISFGIVVTQTLGLFLSSTRSQRWRGILAVGVGLGLLHLLGLFGVVESPKWLCSRDQRAGGSAQTAKRYLKRIRPAGWDVDGEMASWEAGDTGNDDVDEGEALLDDSEARRQRRQGSEPNKAAENEDSTIGVMAVLRHPLHRPAVVAVVGVMLAQQLCGINSIMMYSVSILSKLLPTRSALLTVIISVVNFLVTVACAPLADRIGRKPCLLLSIAGMGANALLLAVALILSVPVLAAVAALLFVVSFAVGLGPVPFILSAELVGADAVGAVQSCALAANWLSTFAVAQFFPLLNNAIDGGRGGVYFVFAVIAAVSFVFVLWRVPESRGKQNADEVWGRTPARRRSD